MILQRILSRTHVPLGHIMKNGVTERMVGSWLPVLGRSAAVTTDSQWSYRHYRVTIPHYQSKVMEEKLQTGEVHKHIDMEVPKAPDGRLIVYRGALETQIKSVKVFSLATSAMGIAMQPLLWAKATDSVAANIAVFSMVGFFTFVTPVLIHLLAKRYVIEILYSPETDSYSIVTRNFFNMRKETPFKLEEVVSPDVPGPFSTLLLKQVINGRTKDIPIFIAPNTFTDPIHFGRIMGFDKPLDFHLGDEVERRIQQKKENAESQKNK